MNRLQNRPDRLLAQGLACVGLCFCLLTSAQAQDKYRSRVYLDMEADPTETVSLSVSELEQKLSTLQDGQVRANAERFLAKHYLGQKDYGKAISHIEQLLQRQGAAAPRELYLQLAQLHLLEKQFDAAASDLQRYLGSGPATNADVPLLLAQIQYQRKQYVAAVDALDKAMAMQPVMDAGFRQTALAIYYGAGQYSRCAHIVRQQVAQDMNNAELWQQWVSLHLKAAEYGPALDAMALAWELGIPFREQDIKLLADLYAINQIPASGARKLESGISSGRVKATPSINAQLFRLWMLAGERDKATVSLEKSARGSGDVELQLHLAQLYMEKEQWQPMYDMVLQACDGKLTDKLVSRANLLLGISQLKLGDKALARRSLINATVVGGETEQASQWLAWMQAEPATERERVGIEGPCSTSDTRSLFAAGLPDSDREDAAGDAESETVVKPESTADTSPAAGERAVIAGVPGAGDPLPQGDPAAVLPEKTTPSQALYYGEYTLAPDTFAQKVMPLVVQLGMGLVKAGGRIDGPLHFIFLEPLSPDSKNIKLRMAFPVSGNPRASGRFKLRQDKGFRCVWRRYEGSPEGVAQAFLQLYADAQLKGLRLSGESRQVIGVDNAPGASVVRMELQLGLTP